MVSSSIIRSTNDGTAAASVGSSSAVTQLAGAARHRRRLPVRDQRPVDAVVAGRLQRAPQLVQLVAQRPLPQRADAAAGRRRVPATSHVAGDSDRSARPAAPGRDRGHAPAPARDLRCPE